MSNSGHELDVKVRIQIEEYILARLKSSPGFSSAKEKQARLDLRHLVLQAIQEDGPADLLTLSESPMVVARILRQPLRAKREDVSRRIQTFRDFLEDRAGIEEASRRMRDIEDRLIPRRVQDWDEVDRVGGGSPASTRARRLLFHDDLLALTVRASSGKEPHRAQRDAALVSLLCFSPLRWPEIIQLTWEQIIWADLEGNSPFGGWCKCTRRNLELHLPVHRRAIEKLALLHAIIKRVMDRTPTGSVFRSLRHPYLQLQYRDAKATFDVVLSLTDLFGTTRVDLLAAYAFHLKSVHGFMNPDLREALGYSEVKHVSTLLEDHEKWALNVQVDAKGGPAPTWLLSP